MTPGAFDSFPFVCALKQTSHINHTKKDKIPTSRTHPVRCWARVHLFQLASTFAPVHTQHTFKFSTHTVWDILAQCTTELNSQRSHAAPSCQGLFKSSFRRSN